MKAALLLALIGSALADAGKEAPIMPAPAKTMSEATYSCLPDWTLNGKICERMVVADPIPTCANGIAKGAQCQISSSRIAKCPAGTQQTAQGCTSTVSTAPTKTCPSGAVDTGFGCENMEYLQIIQECTMGTKEGNQCVTIEALAYQQEKFCPVGYTEEKGGCWKKEVYDCTPPQTGKGGYGFRGLAGKNQGLRAVPNGLGFGSHQHQQGSPTPIAGASGFGAAFGAGAGGFNAAALGASHGFGRGAFGANLALSRSAPGGAGFAIAPVAIAPAPSSGSGPDFGPGVGTSVATASAAVVAQTCERKEAAPHNVNKSCANGYTDNGTGCIKKNYFTPTSRCINGASADACFSSNTVPYKMECGATNVIQNGACVSAKISPMIHECPPEFTDNGTSCIATLPAQLHCEGGLRLSGGLCVGKQTAQPQATVSVTCTGKNCYH